MNNHALHHHTKSTKRIDTLIYIAAILQPLFTIPQIYTVWILQTVEGVSLATWGLYTIFNFLWLWYAVVHKEKPLIITNILWILMQGSVFVGVIIVGN
jgi:uncharacterized protein with PQ loop repeat